MNKILSYLQHFFLLDSRSSHESVVFRDYSGPGFAGYKASKYFRSPGHRRSGYLKSEVATYSEVTKVALLLGMVMVGFALLWLAYYSGRMLIEFFFGNQVEPSGTQMASVLIGLPATAFLFVRALLSFIPRAAFLIKNFKAPKK